MPISLSPETEKLIEERMKQTGVDSPDEMVRLALQMLEQVYEEDYDHLDAETQKQIDEAEAEYQRGGGIPADDAFAQFRRKYLGTGEAK